MYGSGLAGFASFTNVWFQEAYAQRVTGPPGILGATQLADSKLSKLRPEHEVMLTRSLSSL